MAESSNAGGPLILIDGSSYLYRAYHALPALTSTTDEPTGAVYGVASMLRRLLNEYDPQRMAVVFDAPGPTFRSEIYSEYKANRPPMPEDLAAQIEPLKDLIDAFGLPLVTIEGVEADDVIGTLARQERERGGSVLISTGDKDLAQLVDEGTTLVNTMSNEVLDPAQVEHKFGIPPARIVDYLSLVGDTSDNIPGVPKCGPKTAVKWLEQYGDLDAIIEHADDIGGRIGENLRAAVDDVRRARELVTIRRDLDLALGPDHLGRRQPDTARLRELYRRLDFRTWLADLGDDGGAGDDRPADAGAAGTGATYDAVLDRQTFDAWIERLRGADLIAFDTETTSLVAVDAEVVGVSFAVEPGHAAYVPFGHRYPDAPDQLAEEAVLDALRPILEDPARAKVGQNLKYDWGVLANHGIDLAGIRHDTMLESYVLDATATRHDLDSLAKKYLDIEPTPFSAVAGKGRNQLTFDQVAINVAAPYAAEDADLALRLHRELWPRLEALPGQRRLYEAIDMPLVPVLARMERTGVAIDAARLAEQGRALAERMAGIEAEVEAEAGRPFNLNSPKQLQEILFGEDGLGLAPVRRTQGGQPSTAEDVLEVLAADHRLPQLILDYRSLAKLKSTYTDALPQRISARTGRVHTHYQQAVASTGRLSSTEPNLQNIPIRTEEGRRIREAFVAPEGWRLLAADYSQIELRIMAHLSGDAGLLAAFAEDRDIHRATAAEVFGLSPEQVGDDQRRAAKAINFGLIYGMSAWGLGRQLGIGRGDAQAYVDRYFERYPGVRRYMDATREQARDQGYVETVFGRRLYLPEIRSRNAQRRQYAERTAINAPMQGTAADIIKRAMITVDEWLAVSGTDARLIMQVHDELILEVPADGADDVAARIRGLMSAAADLDVPLVVETGLGANWAEAH